MIKVAITLYFVPKKAKNNPNTNSGKLTKIFYLLKNDYKYGISIEGHPNDEYPLIKTLELADNSVVLNVISLRVRL